MDRRRTDGFSGTFDQFFSFIHSCHSATTKADFSGLIHSQFRRILPHSMSACFIFNIENMQIEHIINVSFPKSYLREMVCENGYIQCSLAKGWMCSSKPVFDNFSLAPNHAVDNFEQPGVPHQGITNLAAHGLVDINGISASYFAFAGLRNWTEQEALTIEITVPHMHVALLRVCGVTPSNRINSTSPVDHTSVVHDMSPHIIPGCTNTTYPHTTERSACITLSEREREALYWISMGKSNFEIAQILDISPWTVKIHVRNLMQKLTVSTRGQAIAKALKLGVMFAPIESQTYLDRACNK